MAKLTSASNEIRLFQDNNITNTDGSGSFRYDIVSKYLIDQYDDLWSHPEIASLKDYWINVSVDYMGKNEPRAIGQFKNIKDLVESIFNKLLGQFTVITEDFNSRFPISETIIDCSVPNPDELISSFSNSDVFKRIDPSLQPFVLQYVKENYVNQPVHKTTDKNGRVSFQLLKGITYHFEFRNKEYHFFEKDLLLQKNMEQWEVRLYDIGQKIRGASAHGETTTIMRK